MISEGVWVSVVLGLIVTSCLVRAGQIWLNRAPRFDNWPVKVVRAVPTFVVSLTALFVLGGWLISMPDGLVRSAALSPTLAVYGLLGTLLVGAALTSATAVLGRPSALVPPHLRRATATDAELPEREEVEDPALTEVARRAVGNYLAGSAENLRSPPASTVTSTALRAGSAQVTPRSSDTSSQRRGERLSATLSDSAARRSSTTYRHRYFVVGHIITAAVALPVFILVFRALLENDWWVQAGIYLVAVGLAVWFYLEGRRGIRVSSDGITVVETSYKTEASWGEVKTFVLFEGENGHSPQAYVRLANGRMLRLTGVDGGDFGRWDSTSAERLVGVLNSRLGEARVRDSATRGSTA